MEHNFISSTTSLWEVLYRHPHRLGEPSRFDPVTFIHGRDDRFARLVTHYWSNHAFLGDDELMDNVAALNGIPGVMIHGRYDVSSPLDTPWRLSQTWRSSELHIMERSGHGGAELLPLVGDALGRFAT